MATITNSDNNPYRTTSPQQWIKGRSSLKCHSVDKMNKT